MANSSAPFLQWQAKSVKLAQPSVVRGPTKQVNCCRLVQGQHDEVKPMTYGARWNLVELGRGNRGQSDDRGNSESLHFG